MGQGERLWEIDTSEFVVQMVIRQFSQEIDVGASVYRFEGLGADVSSFFEFAQSRPGHFIRNMKNNPPDVAEAREPVLVQ